MVALLWGLGSLPRQLGRMLVRPLGPLFRMTMASRRRIAERNLEACLPELTDAQRLAILKQCFAALARMLAETAWCWARPPGRLQDMIEIVGDQHVKAAVAAGRGVLVVTGHFTCLEIGAMALAHSVQPCHGIYRPLKNEVVEWYQNRGRSRYPGIMVSKRDMRKVVQILRAGGVVWYAPDQDFGPGNSRFVPFFGIQTATLQATHRLPKMTGCQVVSMFPQYDSKARQYRVEISPCIENYPSDDPTADLARINSLLETQVRQAPEQYWWIHRRFKTRPTGEPRFYGSGEDRKRQD